MSECFTVVGVVMQHFFSPKHIVMKLIDTGRRRREPANI